jgi:6-phosphogluconolactonase
MKHAIRMWSAVIGVSASLAAMTLAAEGGESGAVFVLTNAASGNQVLAYARAADGSLESTPDVYAAGGAGTGTGLGSQGAIIVSDDRHFLFAVNAGSNTVSSFRVESGGVELADTASSGGTLPTSVTFSHGVLYVLNAGTPNNVTGFTVDRDGDLTMIPGATRPLSGPTTNPAQVQFDRDGSALIVSERATNLLDVFVVANDGTLIGPYPNPSSGPVPFGFDIGHRHTLLVSEAGAGGGASSYVIEPSGGLTAASSMIMTGQRAACWTVVTKNGRFGYVINAGTGNISGFEIDADGSAALLDADGMTAVTGGNPTDAALSIDSRYLYVRVAALNAIRVFSIEADGSLTALPSLTGTPAGLAGLAAF